MGYFKPTNDAFPVELRSKDQLSAKEWEYVNGVAVWIETVIIAMEIGKNRDGTGEDLGRQIALTESYLKWALAVPSVSAQYFRDITEHGIEKERQMAYLFEQGNDAVNSASYQTS